MAGRAHTDNTPSRLRAAFLAELRKRGNVTDAARAVQVGRKTVYQWKEAEPDFAAAWDEAIEQAIDAMESEAYRRAVEACLASLPSEEPTP